MSDARLMQILASLARRSPLRTLHTICETQHKISTRKLEQYLEPIGDELAGFAFYLRQDYDQLRTANQQLESNYDEACEDAMEVARKCRRLEGEVVRMREALAGLVKINELHNQAVVAVIGKPSGWKDDYLNDARAALSTNGEVTK